MNFAPAAVLLRIRIREYNKSRVPEEREARLEGRGAQAGAFKTSRSAGLLRHAAFGVTLNAIWYYPAGRAAPLNFF